MTEFSQQCEKGKIKKIEGRSQALKTTNLKIQTGDINSLSRSLVSSGLNPLGNNK